ncbi:MAG TPA: helix-turn-helix domain-containing protein [Candidatus Woesebacteria bacterium]|nr:helix-turn-helix domain-containing protein [Candidatus Woesebacteria bacterium]
MKIQELILQLKIMGLKKREINIYLFLLQNKFMSATQLADKLSVVSQTVYRPIHNLENYGLICRSKQNNFLFQAIKPELGLNNLIGRKVNKLTRVKDILLPVLNSFYLEKLFDAV